MADNEIKIIGDASSYLKESAKVDAATEKANKSLERGVSISRQAAAEEKKRLAEAEKLIRSNETAQERANKQIQNAQKLYNEERITLEQLNREVAKQESIIAAATQREREGTAAYKERKAAIEDAIAASEKEAAEKKKADEEQKKRDQEKLAKIKELEAAEEARLKKLAADLVKVQSPAQKYVEKLKEWKVALQQGNITQEQFNRLKDVELKKLNEATVSTRKLAQETTDLDKSMKAAASGGGGTYAAMLSRVAGYLSAGGVLMAGLGFWKDANRELIEQAAEIAKKYDEIIKKFNIQAGLRGLESDAAVDQISGIATDEAVPIDQALAVSTQLVGSGFSTEEATGDALKAILELLNASAIRGENLNSDELVKSLAMYITSQKMNLTGEMVRKIGIPIQLLSKPTNFNISQLEHLSKDAPAFSELVPWNQQLAAYATLSQSIAPAQASTGMRNYFGRLQTAGAFPERVKALEKLGVTPEQVDFVGEDLHQVSDVLKGAFSKVPEKDRQGLMARLFGEETVAVASAMLGRDQEIRENEKLMTEDSQFKADAQEARTGRGPAAVRLNNVWERFLGQQDQLDDLISQELTQQMRQSGYSPFATKKQEYWYKGARSLGVSPYWAIQSTLPFDADEKGITPNSVLQGVNKASGKTLAESYDELQERQKKAVEELRQMRSGFGEQPRVGPDDTMSRPGFEDVPKVNERGAYEGSVQDMGVSNTIDARAIEQAMTTAMAPLLQRFDKLLTQTSREHSQEQQAMTQQTNAITQNRPVKKSPLDQVDRNSRWS